MASYNLNYFDKHNPWNNRRLNEVLEMQRGVIRSSIHLIASACYPFPSVLKSLGEPSFLLPAEGMPGERYLPGAQVMDIAEIEGERLVLDLFSQKSGYKVSLQPHSGTQANQIVYNAVLKPDDVVLCLKPKDGGHISHTVLISRRHRTYNYRLTPEGNIDYESLRTLAQKVRPRLIIVGGSSLPRSINFKICGEIAKECGAYLHADISHTATFIAAGVHSPAFPYCDFATFNTMKNLRGPNGGVLIYHADLAQKIKASIFPGTQGGANETNVLGKFACFLEWKQRTIKDYAREIVRISQLLGSALQEYGIPLTTNGTDCHILLIELIGRLQTGAELEKHFERMGVLLNKNLIPNDTRTPMQTSGLRIGTTNLAILGYDDEDVIRLGKWIGEVIVGQSENTSLVKELTAKYNRRFIYDQKSTQ